MGKWDEQIAGAVKLWEQGQTKLALDRFIFLSRQPLEETEIWQVYQGLAVCYFNMGEVMKAYQYYWQAICSCSGPYLESQRRMFSNYLFLQHYLRDISDEELAEHHFLYNTLYKNTVYFPHEKKDKARLRIGYLSPDFVEHVDMFFSIQLLACHDPKRYEVFCYSVSDKTDDTTRQLQGLVDGWRDLQGLSSQQAAQRIYEDQIDILFDLSGHANGGTTLPILGYKPAPVQLCGIGYMSTTGLAAVDYFLTDVYCDPPGKNDALFSEKLIRLPHTHLCYTPSERVLKCNRTYQVHHPIVFGSFNNVAKISDEMLQLWHEILEQVPGSRLILKNSGKKASKERALWRRAERIGFTRKNLEIRSVSSDYLSEYMDLDIALDTYPYPGGGTTCEALYMGVPVISLYGTRHGARFGYSLLMNAGLEALTAATMEEYKQRAVALAEDTELLAALHAQLRSMLQQSPLMNGPQYTREVEAAYERIWQTWLKS